MSFLRNLLIISASILLVACENSGNSEAGPVADTQIDVNQIYKWKMVTTWPANFPILQEGVEKFADDVRAMSHGRLDIQVFAGGELVPALQVFDAVSQGAIEMGHGSGYYWAGKIPEAQFFSSVPFGMSAKGVGAWLYHGGGLELWTDVYAPFNVKPFPMGNTGVQMGGWFNKKIESIEDLKGLRMRIPGLGGKVLSKAGGNPVLISGGEIYTALERGIIDATEWIGPFHDMRMGLNRAAEFYYYPGWHEPGTELELMVNTGKWEQLPEDLQEIVKVAAAASDEWILSAMEYHNSQALQQLREKQNIEILAFPDEVLVELKQLTKQTLEEEAKDDRNFRHIYDAYRSFREQYNDWEQLTQEASGWYTE